MNDFSPHNITFIHTGAIGDLVQAAPLLRAIRAQWPDAHVTFIGRPERGALLQMAALVDAVLDAETCGLWRLTGDGGGPLPRALAEADLVLDLLGLEGAAALRARVVRLKPLPSDEWKSSAAEWLLAQAREVIALPAIPPEPVLPVSQAALESARAALAEKGIGGPFAAFHPGSGSARKNWPMERFELLAQRIREQAGRQVVWLLGPAEMERPGAPAADANDAVLADAPLETVAGVLARADVYIGNDSGVTQVAAAVRGPGGRATPTVALFGPTDARVWGPRGSHVRLLRPVRRSPKGEGGSPDGTMDTIGLEGVWSAVREALGEAASSGKAKPRD